MGVRVGWCALMVAAFTQRYDHQSMVGGGVHAGVDRPFDRLGIVKALRKLHRSSFKTASKESKVSDESKKWLPWPDVLAVVATLREEAMATHDCNGRKRKWQSIARSQQQYLLIGILASVPDRQRTLRELQIGKTLVRINVNAAARTEVGGAAGAEEEGAASNGWAIKHSAADYKTGGVYGDRPPLELDEALYPILEDYLSNYRPRLQPVDGHDYLFCSPIGNPLTAERIHSIVTTTTYRLTGKRMNPHLFRDSVVTHLRGSGATEQELEALALLMGHSVAMQKSSYDRRTVVEKVAPALRLLRSIKATPPTSIST